MERSSLLRGLACGLVAMIGFASGGLRISCGETAPSEVSSNILVPRENLVLESAIAVNLGRGVVRLPLHCGSHDGQTCWYILTAVSDEALAKRLGLNFVPDLRSLLNNGPGAYQSLDVPANILQVSTVKFAAAPDFSIDHGSTPGALGASETVGLGAGYSPYVRPNGTSIIYHAPIVAVGDRNFDLATHRNTHVRVAGINIHNQTVDLLFSQALLEDKEIIYLAFDAISEEPYSSEEGVFSPIVTKAGSAIEEFRSVVAILDRPSAPSLLPPVSLSPPK